MKLTIIENDKPHLSKTHMVCDMDLHKKLNKYELTRFLNKHSANLLVGRAGSGKTSLLFSMFKSPDIFKKVFYFNHLHRRVQFKIIYLTQYRTNKNLMI